MANTNNESIHPKDLTHVTSCNTADLILMVVFSDPANTATASLKTITVGHFVNSIAGLL